MPVTDPIRVIVADHHALVREGLREYLDGEDGVIVVAEAVDAYEALELTSHHMPDAVLIDVPIAGMTGVELTQRIKAGYAGVRVVALTVFDDDPYVFALLRAGADGCISKNAGAETLVRTIRSVAEGQRVVNNSALAKRLEHAIDDSLAECSEPGSRLLITQDDGSQRAELRRPSNGP